MPATHTASATIASYRVERGSNQRLVILGAGPNQDAQLALIPEAGALVGDRAEGARIAAELRSRPVLTDGDVIYVQGFEHETYVARRQPHNRDWWKLVPVGLLRFGGRFYYEYEGGDGYKAWKIRDALNGGQTVFADALAEILGRKVERVTCVEEVRQLVKDLHAAIATEECAWVQPCWSDYLRESGKAQAA